MPKLEEHISSLSMTDPSEPDESSTPIQEITKDETVDFDNLPDYQQEEGLHLNEAGEGPSEGQAVETDEEEDWRAKYEEAKRESDGRLGEIGNLRDRMREQSENIEQIRQIMLRDMQEKKKAEEEAERIKARQEELEQYGDKVVNDPHISYVANRIQALEEKMERDRQSREGRMRVLMEQSQRQRAMEEAQSKMALLVKEQEDGFAQEHPDYNDAYEFARNKRIEMYQRRGFTPEAAEANVHQEELYLANEQLSSGRNVAQEIYNWAIDYGWDPKSVSGEHSEDDVPRADAVNNREPTDFEKIQRGLHNASVRSFSGNRASSHGDEYISAEQFYATVPDHIRAQVHADEQMFEELARHGRIKKFW